MQQQQQLIAFVKRSRYKKLYERDARGGTRYIELLKSHFGVTSPDFRLQRPEFLGGSSTRINITPVPQTSSTTGSYAQGALASYGVAADGNSGFTKSFVEHGVIIGLVNVRGDITYEKGLNRMWTRQTREEFYWPALAHLGEQAVLKREIYCDGSSTDDDVFGYQERWAEYRYYPSQITGQLRSSYSSPLNMWHLAEVFNSVPSLDETFIQSNTPVERIVAVKNKKHFVLDSFIELHCERPMPVYSVPGLIDHF